jgi:hypothetical protein
MPLFFFFINQIEHSDRQSEARLGHTQVTADESDEDSDGDSQVHTRPYSADF